MTLDLTVLRAELLQLEAKVDATLKERKAANKDRPGSGSAEAGGEAAAAGDHVTPKRTVIETLRTTSLPMLLTAPFTFSLIVPILLLDLCVNLYQLICFPIWGVEPAQRRDHVVIDRHRLAYLNAFEKLGCIYCGYFNGVIAFTRDVASRTEAYWCPIKLANRPAAPHERYDDFLAYGDADAWMARLDELNRKIG